MGNDALSGTTTGANNIALGHDAGKASNSSFTIAIGKEAGCNSGEQAGVFIGKYAGKSANAHGASIMIGCKAGCLAYTADSSIFIGKEAGMRACNSSHGNIFMGSAAGKGSSTESNNTGDNNIAIGDNTMCDYTSATCNVVIGYYAGNDISSGAANVAVGQCAGCTITTGSDNIALGQKAMGSGAVTGDDNVAIGAYAGCGLTSGKCNIMLGYIAGCNATTGCRNIFMGRLAGGAFDSCNTASDNFFAGEWVGGFGSPLTGGCNIGIGKCAFQNLSSGTHNIALGMRAMGAGNVSSTNNVAIGQWAGGCVSTGYGNLFLGACAGYTGSATGVKTGNKNVAIGYGVTVPDGTANQQLVIGIGNTTWLRGDSSFNIFDKDGNQLNGASGGGGGDKFNTTITNSVQATIYGYETDVLTLPSDDTKRYTIESISVGNVTAGVGSTVNVIASINPGDSTYSSENKVYIAYNIPVPDNGLVELIKQPIVMNPDDVLKVWATNEHNYGINDALELYASYAAHDSTDFVAGYGSTVSVATTALTTVYTSSSNPTVLQSIKLTNRSDAGDFPVTIQLVNGSSVTHLAKNLVIPRYASVELLDRPKRLETDGTVKMQTITAANTIDVVVSGKKITS